MRRTRRGTRGNFGAETAILIVMAVAGLMALCVYVQRALQGSTFSGAQSVGLQFDPRDRYQEDQRMEMQEEVHQQSAQTMVSANHLPQPDNGPTEIPYASVVYDERYAACAAAGGHGVACDRTRRTLESLPTGRVLREPAFQFSKQTANWSATTDVNYQDRK